MRQIFIRSIGGVGVANHTRSKPSRRCADSRKPGHGSPIIRLLIGGEAGEGVLTAGSIVFEAGAGCGLEACLLSSYPANIRGGTAFSLVSLSPGPLLSPSDRFDILIVLTTSAFLSKKEELRTGNRLIIDTAALRAPGIRQSLKALKRGGVHIDEVALTEISRRFAGSAGARNMAAVGVCSAILGIDPELFRIPVRRRLSSKDETIAETGLSAFDAARQWALEHLEPVAFKHGGAKRVRRKRVVLDGNQAVALGALAAGCTFFSSYPITPATSIGNALGSLLPRVGGVSFQAEDEISALGAALGASFSGARAMTATSGPGLSLMQEGIGYASMAELPVVIIDVQRVGPSTGMPTKHEQSDLLAAAFGGHGEGMRIVLSPVSVEDAFYLTIEAFDLARMYRCPVVILTDASFAALRATMARPDRKIYTGIGRKSATGISGRLTGGYAPGQRRTALPGISPDTYCATGVEHDHTCSPVSDPVIRGKRMRERLGKVDTIEQRHGHLVVRDYEGIGEGETADFGVISWGLTAWIVRPAVHRLRCRGFKVAALYPRLLYPVCNNALGKLARLCLRLVVIEANYTGQYANLVRASTGVQPAGCRVYGGEPFTSEEIELRLLELLDTGRVKR